MASARLPSCWEVTAMRIDNNRLDAIMHKYGMTGKSLAEQAGIQATLLSVVRSRGTCSPSTARKLAKVIGWDFIDHSTPKINLPPPPPTLEECLAENPHMRGPAPVLVGAVTAEETAQERIALFLSQPIPRHWNYYSIYQRRCFWAAQEKQPSTLKLVERDRVCAAEVWCELYQWELSDLTNKDIWEINRHITALGCWEKGPASLRFGPYGVRQGFVKCRD